MNYSDLTLDDAYKYSILFDLICDGDKQEIQVIKKEAFDRFVETINNAIKSVCETLSEIATSIVDTLGEALKNIDFEELKKHQNNTFNENSTNGKVFIDTNKHFEKENPYIKKVYDLSDEE